MYTKLRYLSCFNNGLLTNQFTNILTEVVPFCKSDHIYIYIYIYIYTHTYTYIDTYIYIYVCVCVCVCAYI